jgi:hypothetical protein
MVSTINIMAVYIILNNLKIKKSLLLMDEHGTQY